MSYRAQQKSKSIVSVSSIITCCFQASNCTRLQKKSKKTKNFFENFWFFFLYKNIFFLLIKNSFNRSRKPFNTLICIFFTQYIKAVQVMRHIILWVSHANWVRSLIQHTARETPEKHLGQWRSWRQVFMC